MSRRAIAILLCGILIPGIGLAAEPSDADDFVFLDNGHIKLGVKKSSGAGIAWLSASGIERNLINHFDRGRLVQQSYYGKEDGSLWNKQPWRYNPVQGGDWRGKGAKVLELKVEKISLYAKTLPRHWASGKELDETSMDQRIELKDDVVHIHYTFKYSGEETHPEHDQEIPAVFGSQTSRRSCCMTAKSRGQAATCTAPNPAGLMKAER